MKYPYHISEYAHSMGNACGNLIDYWEAIESTNFFIGGAIWDWVDQAMYGYDNGNRYFGYGGDFSQDNKPNDGMFCMNGVMRPDLSPKAQYYEVKKVYQNVGVKAVDMKKGLVEIFNKTTSNRSRSTTFSGDFTRMAYSLAACSRCRVRATLLVRAKSRCTPCLTTTTSSTRQANTL